ncbi:MAG: hypothetical protein AUG51_00785 [Acidobacteria bacterium 13_1_20CM_3_53_8]|nr:MAG: hypothetical protein AUG51_00785 [Acidobacteria bacterium 13_1_20CM_3_53_8]
MNADLTSQADTTSIVLSLFSIAVSFMAIAFSLWIWRESRKSSEEASKTLIEVRGTAESVKDNVRIVRDELIRAVTHRGEDHGWKTEMCCSNNEVMTKEREVRQGGKIYVSVVTMHYEVSQFVQVIAHNLKHGKQYYYFLPEDIPEGYSGASNKFINALIDSGEVMMDVLETNLKIMKVRSGEILCNVTLFDPEFGPDEGYILPAYEHAERAFSVRLDHTLHNRAWNRVQKWLDGDGSTVIWPKPNDQSKESKG